MVRWSATVQGAALRNLFEDGVANPNDNTPAYIHSVRSAHLEHFGTILHTAELSEQLPSRRY
jgi:hypothetical protein